MPVFEYKGLNEAGKTVKGMMEAESQRSLRQVLRKDGVFLTDVLSENAAGATVRQSAGNKAQAIASQEIDFRKLARGRVTTEDIAITTRQLATLLSAGVTLVEALTALVDQVEKSRFKRILSDVKQRVNEGSSLADALKQHEKVFGALYVNMVRAGEHSGALDAVLLRLADFTEGQARLKQDLIGKMIYPAIMVVFGAGILAMLMTMVVPKVTKIFSDMKAALPINTRILIWTSETLADWWYIILVAVIGGVFGFWKWIQTPKGKASFDRKILKAPIFGSLVRMVAVARFSRTLATLLKAGVPLLAAMDIVKNVVTNTVLADVVEKARESIREGESIANPLRRSGEFPPLVYHMVAIGERSGQLEDMLLNVAEAYELQVDVRVGAMTRLLEPLLIVGMGAAIAFIAFSILMPILQINSTIR